MKQEIKKSILKNSNEKLEKRDLYDINRNLTGETVLRGERTPEGRYILVVMVFIENSKGEFLIQKRSESANGKFGTTGGHAKTGENSLQAIQVEVEEELGIKIDKNDFKLIYGGRVDEDRVFFDIFYMKKDLDIKEMTLQKEEVDYVVWFSKSQIKDLINNGEFMTSHAEEYFRMLEIMGKNE